MIREEQLLEVNRASEEKINSDAKIEELNQSQRSRASQKYKTVFNCSYCEPQE